MLSVPHTGNAAQPSSPFTSGPGVGASSDSELPWGRRVSPEQVSRVDQRCRGVPVNVPVYVEPMHFLASVQAFTRGGYEVTVKLVDAQKIADRRCLNQHRGPRLPRPEEEREAADIFKAQCRAKKRVRHLVKEMGADRILTLTTREKSNTAEEMLDRWQRWLRLVERANCGRFHYVAVLEPHPTNPAHLHLHVAIAVFLNVNVLRRCWWQVCGGRGMGNVHIKRLSSGLGIRRVYKVASYISKYLTKETLVRFNKKRYWVSRVSLPEVRRYWLKARTLEGAVAEFAREFGFWPADAKRDTWMNDVAGVAWLQSVPGLGREPPF